MTVVVTNAQREASVSVTQLRRVARCAIRVLKLRGRGTLAITFLNSRRMRVLNKHFLRHDRSTDVLSFRYDDESTCLPRFVIANGARRRQAIGEIFIAPAIARAYASQHRLAYHEELARYVVHGLLHWRGDDDRTKTQQQRMRRNEDQLLKRCRVLASR